VRNRIHQLAAGLFLLHAIATWLGLGAAWRIPIAVAMFACAIIAVAEGQNRSDSHVTLNLRG
jgi:hypothetical protein